MFLRRVVKDIELLKKNNEYLKNKGIYYHFNDNDLTKMYTLISPRHKEDTTSGLISPYTGGFFLFEVKFPEDYPLSPPKVEFNPKTSSCRFHPNYYSTGKVCLSIVNTWGGNDWSPAMSLMALLVTIEERFFERALGCEPGHENTTIQKFRQYNDFVEYHKYTTAIISVINKQYYVFTPFYDIINQQLQQDKERHLIRLEQLITLHQGNILQSPTYGCNHVMADYNKIKEIINNL
jgi:ubiquitin-conjugating enzyme E2 O